MLFPVLSTATVYFMVMLAGNRLGYSDSGVGYGPPWVGQRIDGYVRLLAEHAELEPDHGPIQLPPGAADLAKRTLTEYLPADCPYPDSVSGDTRLNGISVWWGDRPDAYSVRMVIGESPVVSRHIMPGRWTEYPLDQATGMWLRNRVLGL